MKTDLVTTVEPTDQERHAALVAKHVTVIKLVSERDGKSTSWYAMVGDAIQAVTTRRTIMIRLTTVVLTGAVVEYQLIQGPLFITPLRDLRLFGGKVSLFDVSGSAS